MGGQIAIGLRLREDQQQHLQRLSNSAYGGIEIPREVFFRTWSNWISWISQAPDLWVKPREAPTQLKHKCAKHASLEEIFTVLMEEAPKDEIDGFLKYPLPVGYGLILYDLEHRQVMTSQGYSMPDTMRVAEVSSSYEKEVVQLRDILSTGRYAGGVAQIFGDRAPADLLHVLSREQLPHSIQREGVSPARGKEKRNGGPWEHKEGGALAYIQALTDQNLPCMPGIYLDPEPFRKLCALWKPKAVQVTLTPHLFESTHVKEPCSLAQSISRLKRIDAFLVNQGWDARVPAKLMRKYPNEQAFENALDGYIASVHVPPQDPNLELLARNDCTMDAQIDVDLI